ncbi:polysaccharide biosynthesis protein [Steroidobacter sp. S1-65]|uniref:Polysaccharide biosynthesis protein n=1 Tax=Steroidobacter gossypii TaxID=2805490 RepID=A0ABS1WZ03_9GAMM|nr:nucleoside-diphosphate sugar epimerase/dehydratase [Steroidobacter gossypii]MBM0106172.1 polysaccharide biosynthesis protein [Steroidobacter gossypii]
MRNLSRTNKRLVMLTADVLGIPLVFWLAVTLGGGSSQHPGAGVAWIYAALLLTSVPVFFQMGLYRAALRYLGHRAIVAVTTGVTASVALLAIVMLIWPSSAVPISALPIYWAFALIYVGGTRYIARTLLNYRVYTGSPRVVIYGAGEAGQLLAASLSQTGRYQPVGFIDDNPSLHGSIVLGLEVFARSALPKLVSDEGVQAVLLALPSLTRRRRQEILKSIEPLCLLVQTVPDHEDILSGTAKVEDVRDVHPGDLLGRDPVPPDARLLDACIRAKVVLVTGAGGSIGAELCRQIVRLQPARLLLYEISELALYNIERELRALLALESLEVDFVALLGDVHQTRRFREVLHLYSVQTIYHAAAYKHVPIVEQNVFEGIHNNIFGTWRAAEAALETRVETFILISTDKAVNPTSVMGATKRFAELVLQALQTPAAPTRFCIVRFGNVLGSSGSVAPLFREQISRGGPVTVTHPEVSRYFMTIPEAAQLVLQAGSMGQGGDVFVLDMGKPVRIADLAKRMINLMGRTVRDEENPEGDIEIVYTGLRPAEKLREELLIGTNVTGTEHSMIMRAMEHSLPWPQIRQVLDELSVALNHFDCDKARQLLMQTVAEYKPTTDIKDLVWEHRAVMAPGEASNVTPLQRRVRGTTPPHSPTGH